MCPLELKSTKDKALVSAVAGHLAGTRKGSVGTSETKLGGHREGEEREAGRLGGNPGTAGSTGRQMLGSSGAFSHLP